MNFGVLEVANSRATAAPGWAYVPDTSVNTSVTALQPRKRARNQTAGTDTTAKQDAKILRELAALDRENHKDVSIPVPVRHRDNVGRVSHGKGSSVVRKILQSQKTFANHLTDFEAAAVIRPLAPASSQPSSSPSTPIVRATPGATAPHLTSKGTRSHKKKDPNAVAISTPLRRVSSVAQIATASESSNIKFDPDTPMPDTPMLSGLDAPGPKQHPGDSDPLLVSRIPGLPSQAEIEKLLAAPPLSYNEARGGWIEEDRRKPVRAFCEMCGYWGRVRCMRCGGKVCALECLTQHQEECFTRYGA
ncbi:hypothetical protein BGZ60DRAFT_429130 [Tricladium varicosporioides]|nr:hypothetical protein BGZ60DRAFT_429130 [Hymenoscyphus varicosporioides]